LNEFAPPRQLNRYPASLMKKKLFPLFSLLLLTACLNPQNNPVFRRIAKQSDERIAKQTEEDLKKSPVLQEIDRLCTQHIPILDGFHLVRRMSWQSDNPFLSYSYNSSADFQTVRTFYKDYFSRNGWELRRDKVGGWGPPWEGSFRSNGYQITITYMPNDESNYGFFCQKLLYPNEALY
jgi:hypothetical protein